MADYSITGDTRLDASGFNKGLSAMSVAAGNLISGLTQAATGKLTELAKTSVGVGMSFQSSMSQVAATMGVGVDQIQNLTDKAKEMGSTTAFTATQAADALNYLALAGYDANKAAEVLPSVLNLAAAGGMDLAYASDLVTDAMASLNLEANKQNAADVLNKTIAELNAPVVVEVLHTRYPQGAEKQLCQAVSGRQVPSGKLPADAGCCIFNLNTTCAIYRAVYTGMPVVNKVVTVSGSGVIEPKNIECPIGTPISKLFDACGGLREDTYKLIMGGPMMGLAQYNVDVTVGKGTGAMLAFAGKEEQYEEHPQCIRCGKCVGVCPMRLEPVFMYKYLMKGDVDTWQNTLHGMDCIECGACAYTCPARLPLTHAFRMGKQKVNNARMAAKAKAEAEKAAAEKKEA